MKKIFLSLAFITFASVTASAAFTPYPVRCQLIASMQSVMEFTIAESEGQKIDVTAKISSYGTSVRGLFPMQAQIKDLDDARSLLTYKVGGHFGQNWKIVIEYDRSQEKRAYKLVSYSILGFSGKNPEFAQCKETLPPLE